MSADTDVYGMTAEERAAFESEFSTSHRKDGSWDKQTQMCARVWAACAKLYRGKIEDLKELLTKEFHSGWEDWDAGSLRATERQVKNLQIGNNALLARIKELEAEVKELEIDVSGLEHDLQHPRY